MALYAEGRGGSIGKNMVLTRAVEQPRRIMCKTGHTVVKVRLGKQSEN